MIAFIGSVFSPYYHWSGRLDPENHCAVNAAVYGPGTGRWSMTERGRTALRRDASTLAIGASRLDWLADGLTIRLRELAVPHLTPIRGLVRLRPDSMIQQSFALDGTGRHFWRPIAPLARVEVNLHSPGAVWTGHGYFDCNWGAEPLEAGFARWDWSRSRLRNGGLVLYDIRGRGGDQLAMALRFDAGGGVEQLTPPPRVSLPPGLWRVRRGTQADTTGAVKIRRTLVDSPFYTRQLLDTRLYGEAVEAVHESLDLDRFARPLVKLMLPFRMPRRAG